MNDLVKAADAVADRRRVQEWRDTHLIRAPLALSDGWMELRPQFAERIAALPLPSWCCVRRP